MRSPVLFRGRPLLYHRSHYYPDEAVHVWELIHEALQNSERTHDTKTRILLVPNGSYRICGKMMAEAYSKLCPEVIRRIFIIGRTSHFLPYACALSQMDYLNSPLGKLPVDQETNDKLIKTGDFTYLDFPTDTKEQSIEMQLPFISKVMENQKGYFKVVPVYVGTLAHDQLTVVARRFRDYLQEPENAFIFSASLCHWGDIYGFNAQIPDAPTVLDSIKAFDERAIAAMKELRFRPFDEFLLDTKAKVLDNQIIALLLFMVRQLLNVNLHTLISMDEEKVVDQMRKLAKFKLMGQAWSYPDVTPADSCISYVSAVVELDEERYIPEEPPEPNPLNKLC
ncbi:Memo-like protein [Opisthorchis viverrini]|uniref:Uncharacterized protein n=2 Tax=Opisthorchis viverrini TaxID=6198 RepID=A0A075A1M1_OPIVI|nr:hypothetical protein T265_10350 [Opisthorchis viverrini]KER21289.1 hypothetical protein T265_10350 [Opisthorchis viverrini]OON19254.1 Memo-like protein [Opisthorchis viverrini]